jgi:hypothetical protein
MRSIGWKASLAALILSGAVGAACAAVYFPPIVPSLSGYALLSQVPQPCPDAPNPDTLSGAVGTGTPCAHRTDATRPTSLQAAIVTTDGTGAWTVTWAKAFNSPTPYINPQAINVLGQMPYTCNVATSTTTTASGKCWQAVTMTLPSLALNLLGLVLNPTGAAASIQVRVAAREATQ